jgi:hypothetical protein
MISSKTFLSATLVSAIALAVPALAQSDFTEFYFDQGSGSHFYYSPGSVQQNGSLRSVAWTDTTLQQANNGTEHDVFNAQIDCSAQTIQSMSVNRYDAQSGSLIATVDLSTQQGPQSYSPGTMAGDLAARVC